MRVFISSPETHRCPPPGVSTWLSAGPIAVGTLLKGLQRVSRSLVAHCAALVLAFWLYHLWISSLMQTGALRLGTVSHKLAPLYAYLDPRLKGGLLLALGVLGAYGLFLRWLLRTERIAGSSCVPLFMVWMAVITVTVAGIDGNLSRLARPFERTDLEYYGAIEKVGHVGKFIGSYPVRAAEMPMHAQTHPPGRR